MLHVCIEYKGIQYKKGFAVIIGYDGMYRLASLYSTIYFNNNVDLIVQELILEEFLTHVPGNVLRNSGKFTSKGLNDGDDVDMF